MKRTFESGHQKIKRKQKLEEQLKTISKLDKYFLITADNDSISQNQDDKQSPPLKSGDFVNDTTEFSDLSDAETVVEKSTGSDENVSLNNEVEPEECSSTDLNKFTK